jgi:hypothetical protein
VPGWSKKDLRREGGDLGDTAQVTEVPGCFVKLSVTWLRFEVANTLDALVPQIARSGTWWLRNYFVSRRTAQTAGGLAGNLAQIAKAVFKSHYPQLPPGPSHPRCEFVMYLGVGV